MPFVYVERSNLFLTRRVGLAGAEEMGEMLARLRQKLVESNRPCYGVYDAGTDPRGRPDARARQLSATWFAENEMLLEAQLKAVDFAFPNPLSRGVLTAVLWLRKPSFDTHVHATSEEAIRAMLKRAGSKEDAARLERELAEAEKALGG